MSRATLLLLSAVISTILMPDPVRAENWPRWRGPSRNCLSGETGIATEWGPNKNVAWRFPLPGPAGATPVVWEDRIFLTSAVGPEDGADLVLLCVGTDGQQLWRVQVGRGNQNARSGEGNSASPSPVTDGRHVWVFFGTGDLACYDVDGHEVWKFDIQDRYGTIDIQFGLSSTPVLDGQDLYLQIMHGTMRGTYTVMKLVKLNALTGEELWAVDRAPEPGISLGEMFETKHSYASPILYDDSRQKFLVTHGADATVGHRLDDGAEIWRIGGLNGRSPFNPDDFDPTFRFVSSPTAADGVIVIPTAKRGPTVAVRVDEHLRGRIAEPSPNILWHTAKTPDVPCPLIADGLVYCVDARSGQTFCIDLASGQELYYERTHTSTHRASPVYCDGHVYITARDGVTTVLKAGRTFQLVAQNDLGEPMTATPVISGGTLYLRTYNAIYAIRK